MLEVLQERSVTNSSKVIPWDFANLVLYIGPGFKQAGETSGKGCSPWRHAGAAHALHAVLCSSTLCGILQFFGEVCQVSTHIFHKELDFFGLLGPSKQR